MSRRLKHLAGASLGCVGPDQRIGEDGGNLRQQRLGRWLALGNGEQMNTTIDRFQKNPKPLDRGRASNGLLETGREAHPLTNWPNGFR